MSNSSFKKSLLRGVAAFAAVGAVAATTISAAQAGGFALREQSAIGQGASFAGIAAGGQLSSMFWNPATLTMMPGVNVESAFSVVLPDSDFTLTSGTYSALQGPGSVGLNGYIPASYNGAQLTEDLFVGISINAPFGMATKANRPSQTSFHAGTAEIFTTDVKANIAYRISDMLSVGAGVGVQYTKVRITSFPNPASSENTALEGDDFAPTFSLGATITPMEGTEIGIGFRGAVKHKLEGEQVLPSYLAPFNGSHDITADLTLPETVTIGLKQRVTDAFTLLAGFEWTNWSRLGTIPVDGSPLGTDLPFEYKDGWYASVGAEYAYNEALTLRAGLAYEKSPIPDAHRNMRLPDANRVWASAGLSYNISDKLGFDIGYSHLFVEDDTPVSGSITGASYTGTADSSVDIITASLRYQWKSEPLFAHDEPIVRKY